MFRFTHFIVAVFGLILVSIGIGQEKPPSITSELPPDVRLRLGSDRYRINSYLGISAISADGKEIAIWTANSQIVILNTKTGKQIRAFPNSDILRTNQFYFTPDGKKLVGGSQSGINVWSAEHGKKTFNIPPGEKDRREGPISMSGDGTAIAIWTINQPPDIKVMRLADGTELGCIKPQHNAMPNFTLSHDGKSLAVWGNHFPAGVQKPEDLIIARSVHVWDVKTAKLIASLDTESMSPTTARFSPDGKIIATSVLGSIQLWEVSSGKLLKQFASRATPGTPASITFSPDGKSFAVGAGRGNVQSWEIESGKRIGQFQLPINIPPSVQYRSDGVLLAWGIENNSLIIQEALAGKTPTQGGGHRSPPVRMNFTSDGKQLLSYANDNRMIRWDVASGRELQSEQRSMAANQPFSIPPLYSPNGKYFVSGSAEWGGSVLWDASTNEELFPLVGNQGAIDRGAVMAFSADSKRLMAVSRNNYQGNQMSIPVWEVESGQLLPSLKGQRGDFTSAAFSTDGAILTTCALSYQATGAVTEIWSRDVRTGKLMSKTYIANQNIASLSYLDHRLMLIVSTNGTATILDAMSGKELQKLDRSGGAQPPEVVQRMERSGVSQSTLVCISPDRRLIAMTISIPLPNRPDRAYGESSFKVLVWEAASGSLRQESEIPALASSLAFSPDNRSLAVGLTDTTILLYDQVKVPASDLAKEVSLEIHWKTLEDRPAPAALGSMHAMIAKPEESVAFIKTRVLATVGRKPDAARIAKWIADLDSPRYAVRETAMKELDRVSSDTTEQIQVALDKKNISLEMRERLEKLAENTGKPVLETGLLRPLRAIEILERINNPSSKEHLKTLAAGGDSTVTRAARDALTRLEVK